MSYDPNTDPRNVFSPTAPIDEKALFAGRTKQVREVMNVINQKGQHGILFGERGVGKTSLANVIAAFLGRPRILTPRVNCDAMDTFDSIWTKVFDEILMQEKIDPVGFVSSKKSKTATAKELLGESVNPDSVRRALTVIAKDSLPIVIIDEFDRLEVAIKRALADTIKTLSDHSVPATVILVGVADSVDQLIEQHESVERALIQIHMPRMSPEEIRQIIQTGLGRLKLEIEPRALVKIETLARGLPHYAHLLGLHSAEQAIDQGLTTVVVSVVDDAITSAIQGSQQSIKSAWHTATTSSRKDNLFGEVLLACALAQPDELGYCAPQDIREALRVILSRPIAIANFAQHLTDFCEKKKGPILERKGEKRRFRFRFINPLMQTFVVMQGFNKGTLNDDKLLALSH
jgi:Cdc6-like AAA superfamily ATPase